MPMHPDEFAAMLGELETSLGDYRKTYGGPGQPTMPGTKSTPPTPAMQGSTASMTPYNVLATTAGAGMAATRLLNPLMASPTKYLPDNDWTSPLKAGEAAAIDAGKDLLKGLDFAGQTMEAVGPALGPVGPAGKMARAPAAAVKAAEEVKGPLRTPHGFRDTTSGQWAAAPAGDAKSPLSATPVARRDIMTGYDPKPVAQRPFDADYPVAPRSDAEGRLAYTIDGDPITAQYVAGRRRVGGGDEGLDPADRLYMAGQLVDKIVGVPPGQMPGVAGLYQRQAGQDGIKTSIKFRDNLSPGQAARVISHESAHAIDETAGQIDTRGLSQELKQVFHDLATGVQGRQKFRTEPQHLGYSSEEVPRELMAEAIRGYLTDPNYLKSVAPKTAQRIRDFVNTNPRLSKIIQFNTLAGTAAVNQMSPDDQSFTEQAAAPVNPLARR